MYFTWMIAPTTRFYKKWIITFCTLKGSFTISHFEYLALKEVVIFAQMPTLWLLNIGQLCKWINVVNSLWFFSLIAFDWNGWTMFCPCKGLDCNDLSCETSLACYCHMYCGPIWRQIYYRFCEVSWMVQIGVPYTRIF
jgi:hypothetical protein